MPEATEPSREDLLVKGAQLYEAGDLRGASVVFRAALDAQPNQPVALFGLGLIDLREERWFEAAQKGHRALLQAPTMAEGHHLVAQALRGEGNSKRAVQFYRQAQVLQPSYADNVLRLATTLAEVGELAEAAEWLQRFFVSEPMLPQRDASASLAPAHRLLGALWQQLGVLERRQRGWVRRAREVPAGSRPTVLVICPRWLAGGRDKGVSNEYAVMVPTLEATGLADVISLSPDEASDDQPFELALLRTLSSSPVDAIVYTHRADKVPCRLDLLRALRARYDGPMVFVHTDSASAWNIWAADALTPLCDLHVALDAQGGFNTHSFCPWAYVALWNPLDARIFYRDTRQRDIDVCFIGAIGDNPERRLALDLLQRQINNTHVCATSPGNHMPLEQYAEYYRRAKIVLNFSQDHNNLHNHHLKGRILEAMACGAMVLESANQENTRLFEAGRDYDVFTDHPDMLLKIRHYLRDGSERAAIAERGHAKATLSYTGEQFWSRILGHFDLGRPLEPTAIRSERTPAPVPSVFAST